MCGHHRERACAVASVREEIRIGSLVHDIGKIGVDLSVVKKPGKLEPHETERMRRHPTMGGSILARVLPRAITEIVETHHEQPDGGVSARPDR